MKNVKGQQAVGMSFGMIFAIFLIVVFIVIAGIAVNSFLDLGESASVGLFYSDLQKAVDRAILDQEVNSNFNVNLPGDIERICFGNLSAVISAPGADYDAIRNYDVYDANLFLIPPEKAQNMQWKKIDRINISKMTAVKNPYCVDVESNLKIKKSFYDRLVVIE